jgi:hypothetical protein
MSSNLLLDTDILVNVARGNLEAIELFNSFLAENGIASVR